MPRASSLLLLLALASCTAAPPALDASLDAGPPPSLDEVLAFERDYARARCEREVRCGRDERRVPQTTFDSCWRGPLTVASIQRRFESRPFTFDPEAAAACLVDLATFGCGEPAGPHNGFLPDSDPPSVFASCDRAAFQEFECAPGLVCGRDESCVSDGCSRCVPRSGLGGPCGDGVQCQPDLACDSGSCIAACRPDGFDCGTEERCIAETCVLTASLPTLDQPCTPLARSLTGNCAVGYCDTVLHVCLSGAALDQPCTGRPCGWGLECDPTTRTCVSRPAGASCVGGAEASCSALTPFCHHDLCTAEPAGARCVIGVADLSYERNCDAGHACVQPPEPDLFPVCIAEVTELFAPCGVDQVCAVGMVCRGDRCVRRVPPWEPCGPTAADAECPPPYACVDGACLAPPNYPGPLYLGDLCTTTRECGRGQCVDGRCALAPNGATCTLGRREECANDCIDGVCGDFVYPAEGEACDLGRSETTPCASGQACRFSESARVFVCHAACP